jgi:hypothetical protein
MHGEYKIFTCQFLGEDFDPWDLSKRFDENGNWLTMPHFMCGEKVVDGRSYCGDHLWKIYKKGTAVKRKRIEQEVSEIELLELADEPMLEDSEDSELEFD